MNPKTIFIVVSLLAPLTAVAQQSIYGRIEDEKGMPIEGVNIRLSGSYDGGISNKDGTFSFTTLLKGTLTFIFSHVNYENETQTLPTPLSASLHIRMKSKTIALDEVLVKSNTISIQPNRNIAFTRTDLVSSPLSSGDLGLALRITPGVQQTDNREGLFVRGGDLTETAVHINGIRIPKFFNTGIGNVQGRTKYPTQWFKGINFSTSDMSVETGNALSGVLNLKLEDRIRPTALVGQLSPFSFEIGTELPLNDKASQLTASFNYENPLYFFPLFLKKDWTYKGDNQAYNGIFGYAHHWENSNLYVFTQWMQENGGYVFRTSPSSFAMQTKEQSWSNIVSYEQSLGNSAILQFAAGYQQFRLQQRQEVPSYFIYESDSGIKQFQISGKVKFDFHQWRIMCGNDGFMIRQYYRQNRQDEQLFASYLSAIRSLFRLPLYMELGIRTEYSNLYRQWSLLPRFSISYKPTSLLTLTAGSGEYEQDQHYFLSEGFTARQKARSRQVHFTVHWQEESGRTFRVQAYRKIYDRLTTSPSSSEGKGYANGFDVFWRDKLPRLLADYTLSYSFVRTRRHYFGEAYYGQPTFAARHNFSSQFRYFHAAWNTQFGIAVTARSELPYVMPDGTHTRLPGALSVHFNCNHLFRIGKLKGILAIGLPAIGSAHHVYGYRQTPDNRLLSITSPFRQMAYAILIFNFGFDKRQHIIHNN